MVGEELPAAEALVPSSCEDAAISEAPARVVGEGLLATEALVPSSCEVATISAAPA